MTAPYKKQQESSVKRALRQSQRKDRVHILLVYIVISCITVGSTNFIQYGMGPANEVSCILHQLDNPTFREMALFIAVDKTDIHPYTESYVCHHFTHDVIMNAKQHGIQAGYVILYNKPNGHAIVAFQTIDQGLYFVEPQSDNIITEKEMEQMVAEKCYRSDPQNPNGIRFTHYGINWFYGK